MVDGPDDVGVARRERVSDGRRRVLRAVVDGDDLERVGEGRQGLERLGDERLEVRLLVVCREEVRQARDACRGGGAWGHAADCTGAQPGRGPSPVRLSPSPGVTWDDPGGCPAGVVFRSVVRTVRPHGCLASAEHVGSEHGRIALARSLRPTRGRPLDESQHPPPSSSDTTPSEPRISCRCSR